MPMATTTTRTKAVSVPAILLALAVLACLLIANGLYGLLVLFGPPDLSPALLTVLALCFLVLLAAAAAAGSRRALLPREEPGAGGDHVDVMHGGSGGGKVVALPTTAEDAAVGVEEPHHQLAADEETAEARRAGLLQTQDYPGSGANSRHDPRNPH